MSSMYPLRTEYLLRVEAPHMVAGVVVDPETGLVVHAADILHWMVGKPQIILRNYCKKRGWKCAAI